MAVLYLAFAEAFRIMALTRSLDEIITDIQSADHDIRRFAIRDLSVSSFPDKIKMLKRFLESELDVQIKYELRKSINELESIGEPAAKKLDSENLRNLNRAFESSNVEVVNKAFLYAVKHRLEEFLPEMLLIETYTQDAFHKMCNIRLMMVSGDKNFPHILAYLDDAEPRVISTAIEALEILGNTTALASITRFASHEHNRVRATAIKALHNLGDSRAFALFTRMVQSPDSAYRDSAAFAVAQLNIEQGVKLLSILLLDEVESIRAKALSGLENMALAGNGQAKEVLLRLEKENPFGLWPSKIWEKFGGDVPKTAQAPAALDSDVQELRMSALNKLTKSDQDEDWKGILQRLKIEKDYKVIAAGVTALGKAKGNKSEIIPVLEKYLTHHNDRVRANAIESFIAITPDNERAVLVKCLDDSNNRVVGNAIVGLYNTFKNKTEKALTELVRSPHKVCNLTAVFCIGEIADFKLSSEATKLLKSRHPEVREKMETVLKLFLKDIPAFKTVLDKYTKEQEEFQE